MVDRIRTWPTWRVVALFVAPYLVVVGAGAFILHRFDSEDKNDQIDNCIATYEARGAVKTVVEFIVDQPPDSTSDLTQVSGFESLAPEIQTYLRNLSIVLQASSSNERTPREQALVDFIAVSVPLPDCEALADRLGIDLPDSFRERIAGDEN